MDAPETKIKLLSSFYGELNALRFAISNIPLFGSYIDATLAMPGQQYVEQRLQYLINQLQLELDEVKGVVMDMTFLNSEEGYDLVTKTFIAAAKTRQREKLNLFAKILRGAYTEKSMTHDPELYVKLVDELSERELAVAQLFCTLKPSKGVVQRDEDGKDRSTYNAVTLSEKYPLFTIEELQFILPRLEKSGLLKIIIMTSYGYSEGTYLPTDQLMRFIRYIIENE